jgi:hypothetical protein
MRDPFKNPFPETDIARHSIWEMLVTRDIDAFLAADWSKVAEDFVEDGFIGINANRDANPDNWRLSFPSLSAYRNSRRTRAMRSLRPPRWKKSKWKVRPRWCARSSTVGFARPMAASTS